MHHEIVQIDEGQIDKDLKWYADIAITILSWTRGAAGQTFMVIDRIALNMSAATKAHTNSFRHRQASSKRSLPKCTPSIFDQTIAHINYLSTAIFIACKSNTICMWTKHKDVTSDQFIVNIRHIFDIHFPVYLFDSVQLICTQWSENSLRTNRPAVST